MVLLLGALGATGTFLFARAVVGVVYGSKGFAPAATVLEVFSPGLLLLFVDILLGNIVYACGGATGFAIAKIVSVAASAGLDLVLIPLFQARTGNGGIGAVVAFGASEFIVFAGALIVLPKGALSGSAVVDVGRALAAGIVTVLLFRFVPGIPPLVGIPLCILIFTAASTALGLLTRRDLELLQTVLRRPKLNASGALGR
jgi:hypothetical protein